MSITARDLFFVLRVRDEASNALSGVAGALNRLGVTARSQTSRAQAAYLRDAAARMQVAGATRAQIDAVLANADALDLEARRAEVNRARQQRLASVFGNVAKTATLAGVAMIGAAATVASGLYAATQAAVEYNRQVALTKTQVDGFSVSLDQLSKIGIDTANSIAVPFAEIQPALYDIFSSTDANLQQATVLLQAFAKAAVAGQVSIQDSSRATMGLMNAFKIPFQNVNQILDVQFQLVRKGVGTYGQFASVIGRATPSAVRYGQSIQTLSGALAFLTRNGLSPAMAAASAARAMDALDNPNAVSNLKALGIASFDAAGNFRPMTDVLADLRKKIMALPPAQRTAALFSVFKGAGGTIQAMRFLNQVILKPGQLESLISFITDMQKATGQFGTAYNQMAGTAAAQTQLLKNKWETLKVTVGNVLTPVLIKLVTWLNLVFTAFEKLSPKTQKQIILALALGTAILGIAGAISIVVGAISGAAEVLALLGTPLGEILLILGLIAGALYGVYYAFKKLASGSEGARKFFVNVGRAAQRFWGFLVGLWKEIARAYDAFVKPALSDLVSAFEDHVLPAIKMIAGFIDQYITPKFKEALRIIKDFVVIGLMYMAAIIRTVIIPIIKNMGDFIKAHSTEIKDALQVIGYVIKFLLIIFGLMASEMGGALIVVIIAFVGALWLIVHVIVWVIEGIRTVINWFKMLGEHISHIGKWISDAWTTVRKFFSDMQGQIISFFANAGTWLFEAGKNLIAGLINGVKSMFGSLGSTMSSIGKFIVDNKGPKAKDLRMLVPHGGWIMQGLAKGMRDNMRIVDSTINSINTQISRPAAPTPPPRMEVRDARYTQPQQPQSRQIQQNITIHTQEINPRRHAAELGWELSNRT